ncbi:recombinase family protein [Metabacillus fastidiosus]|uniref:recombinase family protein n=1 Tax=Metabacillus fastidiosus TaxID=1458 RepID=UPI003D27BCFC
MYRPKGLNIDIYLRKSRKDIDEEKRAIENGEDYDTLSKHRNQLLAIAKKEQHLILEIHEEVVSGEFISERPKIQQLIRRVESGITEAVLVMDLDRLGRGDMLDQGLLDRAFRYSETKIITPTDFYDPSDDSWELVFGVKSLVARQELKAITRRLQGGRHNSASEGKSISKKPPFGYLRDENLKLYPDPDNAWAVKKMFELMRDGKGRQAVSNELDRLGVKPPFTETWSPSTISEIIKNEVYMGHLIWGKFKSQKRNGKYIRKRTSPEEWIVKENAHEAIVSKELWDAANKSHSSRLRPSTKVGYSLSNPLAGVLRCHCCDYSMLNTPRKDRPNSYVRCTQKSCRDKQKNGILALVEERVLLGLREIVKSFEFTEEKREESSSVIPIKLKIIDKKETEKAQLNKQKDNLHDLLEQGVYDIKTFKSREIILSEKIEKIENEINELKEEIQQEEMYSKNINEYVPKVKHVIEAYYQTDDIEKKNQLLKSVLEKATYLRKKEWKELDHFEIHLFPKI